MLKEDPVIYKEVSLTNFPMSLMHYDDPYNLQSRRKQRNLIDEENRSASK